MFAPAEGRINPQSGLSGGNIKKASGLGDSARISIGQKSIIVATRRTKYISFLKRNLIGGSESGSGNLVMLTTIRRSHEIPMRVFIMIRGVIMDSSVQPPHISRRRLTVKGPNRGTRAPIIVLDNKKNSAKWKRNLAIYLPEGRSSLCRDIRITGKLY